MKDAFTTAYSDVVRHQVELTSTIESLISDKVARGASIDEADKVLCMLAQINARVNRLSHQLAARYEESAEEATPDHPTGTSPT
jgi:hypothetical protein